MRLRAAMARRGVTLQQVAKACGVAVSTVGAWTQGKNWPQVEVQPKLARFLGSSISFLIHGITEEPQSALEKTDKVESPHAAPTLEEAPQASFGGPATPDTLRAELRRHVDYITAAAGDDPVRLGWLIQQARAHLRKPDDWAEPETPQQIAARLGLPTMGLKRELARLRAEGLSPQPGQTGHQKKSGAA